MRGERVVMIGALAALAIGGAGCGATDSRSANAKADALVRAARARDLAPNLTNEVARTLYGNDGGRVCGTLVHDKQPTLLGLGRTRVLAQPEEHSDDLVAYDRLVVGVYCRDELGRFDEIIDQLHVG
jgi:hypothetical protein